jgi:hypothetical protein
MSNSHFTQAETLHRLIKHAIDSGAARSVTEAQAMFDDYKLSIAIDVEAAQSPHHQATLLTAVALGRRVFLGGVTVDGALHEPVRVPLPLGSTLGDAVHALGANTGPRPSDAPLISVGGPPSALSGIFHVRTACAGWRGGVVPAHSPVNLSGPDAIGPACMLAAGLAVNEAFSFVSSPTSGAGRRARGMSLWAPCASVDWTADAPAEPALEYLPSSVWLIGLGHLGQAYLWGLGMLPYADPSKMNLVLQDVDVITPSTESTSVLSDSRVIGVKKTRAMAGWAERRGFTAAIHERLFDSSFRRQPGEPAVALCGLDNAVGRRALDKVGFDLVVEAGLGRGHRDFRTIRLHTLPGPRAAADIWPDATEPSEDVSNRHAYTRMFEEGTLDRCGMMLLAGKAVGAPFIGAVAASLTLSELLRLLHGGPVHQFMDMDLQSLEHRTVISHTCDFGPLNPGFLRPGH